MSPPLLQAVVAQAGAVPADERAQLQVQLELHAPPASVLLSTCHRVELYGHGLQRLPDASLPDGVRRVDGPEAARHLLSVAVGRESAVVAEDELLHQLRGAAARARGRGPLPPDLDRLLDLALRAGRRARSWLPARRPSLAETAIEQVLPQGARTGGPVLVVGAGQMGRRAAGALAARRVEMLVASRTPERAAGLAARLGARAVAFDPGEMVGSGLHGAVLALAGPWRPSIATQSALLSSGAWVVDLSAPSCLPAELADRLGQRLLTIDQLAVEDQARPPSPALLERLDRLVEKALAEWQLWAAHESQRAAARALAQRAAEAQAVELDALWERIPHLEAEQRVEVERMARHLTERLLRDPLERLSQDGDGRHALAARDLFRL
ncbi:MAG TPA: NAD(P)-binding domain-containing protein [Candidatus Limnocylindria bacterium]|nr:NAD(P)-binding domain-containing protein [Candidatus Limnocylindria bacterium]